MPAASDFETWEELGRNAYGTVFRGMQFSLKRDVAVFELEPGLRKEAEQSAHFWDQVTQIAQLTDDALVPVYAVDRERGWIVMELMSGNCSQLLTEPQAADIARSILRQGLSGLSRLHDVGRPHGDLRPHTLLIHRSGRIKLSFSLDTAIAGGLPYRQRSMKYAAPELISPALGEYGPRADLYTLGFSVLELMVGPKFDKLFPGVEGDDATARTAWMRWHASEQTVLPSVAELVPGTPHDLVTVLDKLLKKRSADRYATAAEPLHELSQQRLATIVAPGMEPPTGAAAASLQAGVNKLNDPRSAYDAPSPPEPAAAPQRPTTAPQKPAVSTPQQNAAVKRPAAKPASDAAKDKRKKQIQYAIIGVVMLVAIIFILRIEDPDAKKAKELAAVPAATPSATPLPTPTPTPTPSPSPSPTPPPPKPTPSPTPPPAPPNRKPVFKTIADRSIGPAQSLTVKLEATDPDDPKTALVYALDSDLTKFGGATIDAATGVVTLKSAGVAPGKHLVAVRATDKGTPPATGTLSFHVRVRAPNVAPEIRSIDDPVVALPLEESPDPIVSFKIKVRDPDDLGGLPRFALDSSKLDGVKVDARTGLFTWNPPDAAAVKAGTYDVTIEAFDSGDPPLSAKRTFRIIVRGGEAAQ